MKKLSPWYLPNGHLQTIIPSLLRKPAPVTYVRERITTADQDFLDLDWAYTETKTSGPPPLLIISHGLEGDSQRAYVKGMAKAFLSEGYDVLAWNYRGCSGEPNARPHFYHSGATHDLEAVISYSMEEKAYKHIILVGFSLGGNLTLKYVGELGKGIKKEIKKAIAISVPLDLAGSSAEIGKFKNKIYELRFLNNLRKKLRNKLIHQPEAYSLDPLKEIKSLWQFDDAYTAPLHGFKNAAEYYSKCSSLQYLEHITIPTLIINAKNDPFLSPSCYPEKDLKNHPYVQLEVPETGGHVGFKLLNGQYYSEVRAVEFAKLVSG
jgi:predicted alpha/beta-fold hydrolase